MRALKAVLFVAVGAVLFGCVGCEKRTEAADELVVLCGSSFVGPTEQLCAEFTAKTGIAIVSTVAGSEDFLPQVQAGSQGDVLVTHDPFLDHVKDAGKYFDQVSVGFVAPVLAVQKGNPKGLSKIEDLTQEGLKVGLTDPQYSTAGEMVFGLLEKKGIKEAVLKNVGNRLTKGHSALGTYLKTESVDAVVMWNGVAHTFRDSLDVVKTPYEYDEEIAVHMIGLNYSKHTESLKKFMEFLRDRGPVVFSEFGYVK